MQNLKVNSIDWRERRLNRKLYVDQSVNLKLDQGRRLEEELDKDAVCRPFYSTCIANILPKKLLRAAETSK